MRSKLAPFLLSFLFITCVAGIPIRSTRLFKSKAKFNDTMLRPYPIQRVLRQGDIITMSGTGTGMLFTIIAPPTPPNATLFVRIDLKNSGHVKAAKKKLAKNRLVPLKHELQDYMAIMNFSMYSFVGAPPLPTWRIMQENIAAKAFHTIMDVYNELAQPAEEIG